MAFTEAVVYLAYTVIDNAYGGLYSFVLQDDIVDAALIGLILCGFFQAGQDEDVEIGDIFVGDVAFSVDVFDPFAASVAAEQDYHVRRWELLADDAGD